MTVARKVDISTHVIGLDRNLAAKRLPALDDPGMPVDGLTFGVARMSGNAPHGGDHSISVNWPTTNSLHFSEMTVRTYSLATWRLLA